MHATTLVQYISEHYLFIHLEENIHMVSMFRRKQNSVSKFRVNQYYTRYVIIIMIAVCYALLCKNVTGFNENRLSHTVT